MTYSQAVKVVTEYVEDLVAQPDGQVITPTGEQQAALFIVVAAVIHRIRESMPIIEPEDPS